MGAGWPPPPEPFQSPDAEPSVLGCFEYGTGSPLEDPQAQLVVLSTEAGSGRASIVLGASHSSPIGGLSFSLRLPADILASHERELVDYYVERRGHYGTAIDGEATWQEYRSFTYHTLMTIVVSIGFGALNEEQDVLMTEILSRAVAAVRRVDYAGWLHDFLD